MNNSTNVPAIIIMIADFYFNLGYYLLIINIIVDVTIASLNFLFNVFGFLQYFYYYHDSYLNLITSNPFFLDLFFELDVAATTTTTIRAMLIMDSKVIILINFIR